MYDMDYRVSVKIDASRYLRIGELPRYELDKGADSGIASDDKSPLFVVFIYNEQFPDGDLEILTSVDTLHAALTVFDGELRDRGIVRP